MPARQGENLQGSGHDDVYTCQMHGNVDPSRALPLGRTEDAPLMCGECLREKLEQLGICTLVKGRREYDVYGSARFGIGALRKEYRDGKP